MLSKLQGRQLNNPDMKPRYTAGFRAYDGLVHGCVDVRIVLWSTIGFEMTLHDTGNLMSGV